jgi:hypothetical protein
MRIPQSHINSAMYIYGSEEDARNGVASGGSGFFVGIATGEAVGNVTPCFVYAVTNVHVIAHCSNNPVIRANKREGGFEFIVTSRSEWQIHPDGDDIAVCQLKGMDVLGLDIGLVFPTEFITRLNLQRENLNLGPGDNTYMIGRFTNHEGQTANTPIVRYGNISLNPDAHHPVYNGETQHDDEVFLIEARSVSGYSGSAVFTYINELDYRDKPIEITLETNLIPKPYFLGVNIGHTRMLRPVQVKKPQKPTDYVDLDTKDLGKLYSGYNSGIMRIAPAWKLQEMLDMEVFADVIKKAKKDTEDQKRKAFTLDSLPPETRESLNITKKQFESSLKKVSRKLDDKNDTMHKRKQK